MARTTKAPKPATASPARGAPLRARFFPTTPRVTAQIEEWARASKVRVRAVIPIYTEDSEK